MEHQVAQAPTSVPGDLHNTLDSDPREQGAAAARSEDADLPDATAITPVGDVAKLNRGEHLPTPDDTNGDESTAEQLQMDLCTWLLLHLGNALRGNTGSTYIMHGVVQGYAEQFDLDVEATGEWAVPVLQGWV